MATLDKYDPVLLMEVLVQETHFLDGDLSAVVGLRIGTGAAATRVSGLLGDPAIAAAHAALSELIEQRYIELSLGGAEPSPESPPNENQL